MKTIRIKDIDAPIKDGFNFTYREFYHPKFAKDIEFDIPECLVDAQQILRSFYGRIQITSTIRPKDTFGYHRFGWAVDCVPIDDIKGIDKFILECKKYQSSGNSQLIEKLRSVGVQGFGIEAGNCIHLDWRDGKNVYDIDQWGKYIVFEWRNDGTANGKSIVYRRAVK